MTQAQLECAVADALGEPLGNVHLLGFQVVPEVPTDLEPEELTLCIECPFCRNSVPYPGPVADGELPLGECEICDVYFIVEPDDVFAASTVTADREPVSCFRTCS